MQTVLITGCSSGFGLAIANTFLDRDWMVVATMRRPWEDVLPPSDRLRVLALDVTDQASIDASRGGGGPDRRAGQQCRDWLAERARGHADDGRARAVRDQHARHDGDDASGPAADARATGGGDRQRFFKRNAEIAAATVRLYSEQGGGERVHESLAFELEPFGVRVRLVLPGRAPDTRFGDNARARMQDGFPEAYAGMAQQVFAAMGQAPSAVTHESDVTDAVLRAATDPSCPMRLPAGADAVAAAGGHS